MPNWCLTHFTFYANDDSDAIYKFHKNLMNAAKVYVTWAANIPSARFWRGPDLWLVDIATYHGIDIDVSQRGYVDFIQPDVTHASFQMAVYDAWAPNIAFWAFLIHHCYNDKIGFLWDASEPGMGIYLTNDKGLLPRYSMTIAANDIDDVLKLDRLFDQNNAPFWYLNNSDVNVYEGYWLQRGWNYDTGKPTGYQFVDPNVSYYSNIEGDDWDCLEFLEDHASSVDSVETVEDALALKLPIHVDPFIYQSTESCTRDNLFSDALISSISDGTVKQKSADELFSEADNIINNGIDAAIKPIVDNPDLFRKVNGNDEANS